MEMNPPYGAATAVLRHYVDGQWIDGASDAVLEVINPASEAVIGRIASADAALVDRAVESARRAFDRHGTASSVADRTGWL